MASYWERALTRRRALVGTAALGIGAAALAACGGGSDGGGDGGDGGGQGAGLVGQPIDTTSQGVKGGIVEYFIAADVPNFDPTSSASVPGQTHAGYSYSRLLQFVPGRMEDPSGDVVGDLAESFEVLDGGLRLVFKLRANAGTDSRPPTSGRNIDAQDVVFSYKRFEALNPQAADFARSVSATAPVESLDMTDNRTIVVRLAEPYVPALHLMASARHLWVIPREADSQFDPTNTSRGSGPWNLERYVPSSVLEYRRNNNWYNKERPFLDGWNRPIVTEYAQQLAQFRAKNIWYGVVRPEDILPTKRDIPQLNLRQDDEFLASGPHLMFGFKTGSPYNDERVRQAISMLIDREIYTDTFFNVSNLVNEGIPVEVRQMSHLPTAWSGIWMDPGDSEFGPNGKYFAYNVQDAKALLAAAGYPNGFETDWSFTTTMYGTDWPNKNEVLASMVAEGSNIKVRRNGVDYATVYIPNYYRGLGNFDGISTSNGGARPDPGVWMQLHYHTNGSVGHWKQNGDPAFDRMIDAQFREFDAAKRVAMIKDIQRYAGKLMPTVPMGGNTAPMSLHWPWLMNYGVYRPRPEAVVPTEVGVHMWYDRSKHTV